MSEILRSLGQLFVQAIPTVIFVFLLLLILERWFFKPLTTLLKQRQEATVGALERARAQAAEAESTAREYEAALQAARQELYRQREADRREALGERERALQKARQEAEAHSKTARAELAAEVEAAKHNLEQASRSLAQSIAEAVTGNGPEKGARL
jgi:F-type H+-transporting ATPase subunit b